MPIPTEPIGSIPRPPALLEGIQAFGAGRLSQQELDSLYNAAILDTIQRFEATGSPVITDGEQTKPSFATYPIHGLVNLAPDGATIPFADGHVRQLPRLTAGPFRYTTYADEYLAVAKRHAHVPVKQAVISASALSLLYPASGIEGYSREEFIEDLLRENEADIRRCLQKGAYKVQIDFTEGRLAVKLDPSKGTPEKLHRPQQSGPGSFLGSRAKEHRGSHLPRGRSGFDSQRGCRLRRPLAELVRTQGWEFLHSVGQRERPWQGSEGH